MPASTCLLVEPNGTKFSYYAELILQTGCFELMVAHTDEEARRYVSEHSWLSTVIVDTTVGGYAELVRFVRRRSPNATIVLLGDPATTALPEADGVVARQSSEELLAALRVRSRRSNFSPGV